MNQRGIFGIRSYLKPLGPPLPCTVDEAVREVAGHMGHLDERDELSCMATKNTINPRNTLPNLTTLGQGQAERFLMFKMIEIALNDLTRPETHAGKDAYDWLTQSGKYTRRNQEIREWFFNIENLCLYIEVEYENLLRHVRAVWREEVIK